MPLVFLLLCLIGFAPAARAASVHEGLDILVVSSFAKNLPASDSMERGLDRALGHRAGRHRVYFEYLDIPRLNEADAVPAVAALIAQKYRNVAFDAVIAWGVPAARVVAAQGATLDGVVLHSPEVSNEQLTKLGLLQGRPHAFSVDYDKTLAEALRLSGARRMVVIGENNPTGLIRLESLRQAAKAHPDVAIEEWVGLPLDVIQDRVALLPRSTMVFYLLLFSDGRGVSMTPLEAAGRLAERSTAPIFSAWESLMGSGVVGGFLLSHEELGRQVGLGALGMDIPEGPPMRHVYDWRQIERWGFEPAVLPAESVILHRQPSLLEQYRWHLAVIAAFIISLLLLALLLARALRLKETALRQLAAERQGLAARVEERTALLARSNADLEQFAYAISHDLRQPLRMVSSFLQLSEKRMAGKLDDETRTMIGFAINGAKRMDSMILSLLDYSRVGRQGDEPAPIDSRRSLDEALDFLGPAIAETKAEIVIAGDWPQVFAPPDAFERVLLNLVGNALKFRAPETPPRIEVTADFDGAEWRFSVADNGIGIVPEDANRLFQVFQRLVAVDAYEGTGVGLALCRRIVERLGGRIWVESKGEGQGATFRFTIPKTD